MKLLCLLSCCLAVMLAACGTSAPPPPPAVPATSGAVLPADIAALLRAAGATDYALAPDAGAGLSALYLGYAAGKPVAGLAVREVPTYKPLTTALVLMPDTSGYRIAALRGLNMDVLPGKSRELGQKALDELQGKSVPDGAAAAKLVDAVSGATKYYQAIYVSAGLMAQRLMVVLAAPPDWPRQPLPAA